MKASTVRGCGVLVAVLALASSAAHAELVVNGGFEDEFTGWTTQPALNGLSNFGTSDIVSPPYGPHSGLRYAYFGAQPFGAQSSIDDQVFQTVPTTAGQEYELSFWLVNYFAGDDHLAVSWEGNVVFEEAPVVIVDAEAYYQIVLPVVATTDGSELRFAAYDQPAFNYLDDVSVTEVPEPATGAGLLLAAGALTRGRRRHCATRG